MKMYCRRRERRLWLAGVEHVLITPTIRKLKRFLTEISSQDFMIRLPEVELYR